MVNKENLIKALIAVKAKTIFTPDGKSYSFKQQILPNNIDMASNHPNTFISEKNLAQWIAFINSMDGNDKVAEVAKIANIKVEIPKEEIEEVNFNIAETVLENNKAIEQKLKPAKRVGRKNKKEK